MTKLFFKSAILAFALLFFPAIIHAADLNIICHDGTKPTYTVTTPPLFQLEGFAPGDSSTRTVNVLNTDPNNPCQIFLQGSGTSNALTYDISFTIDSLYNKTLADFINGDNIQIADLQPNQSIEHTITLHFNENTDNTKANTNTTFGIKINSQWGANTSAVNGQTTTNNSQEEVLGTQTGQETGNSCNINTLWWIPIVVQTLLTMFVLLFNKSLLGNSIIKLLFTLALGVLAFFITKQIGCGCNVLNLCKYIWILNILLGITPIPIVIKRLIKR